MPSGQFNHNYFVGYVSEVSPQYIKIHFPSSVLLNKFIFSGEEFNGGLIGNFVAIEGENHGFIGKVIDLALPEPERLKLSEKAFQKQEFHPVGRVEILLSFDYFKPLQTAKGLDCFPNIGAKVFVCNSKFIQKYINNFGVKTDANDVPTVDIGFLTSNKKTKVTVSQQALFSRHCAVVGTTGGGKSWTVARLLEEMVKNKSKAILIDATGEYGDFDKLATCQGIVLAEDSYFHYSKLTFNDIFFLLKPSEKVQAHKLMEAVRSLKMVRLCKKDNLDDLNGYIDNDVLVKADRKKRPIQAFYYKHISRIEDGLLDIDISRLARQLTCECIFDSTSKDLESFGQRSESDIGNCVSLISRINNLISTAVFNSLFGFDKDCTSENELTHAIDRFIESDKSVLRIGFESVGYEFQAREIVANCIAKNLLHMSRSKAFKAQPLVLFVDEAHQYLNKTTNDLQSPFRLDAFDQIAKECRKYGLFLCLATQMPRDIPIGTLSQMGTFIVHRLINHLDKESIGNACSSANHSILSFLPVLGEGEAVLTGIDFPMPLSIKVIEPTTKPDSKTPCFSGPKL